MSEPRTNHLSLSDEEISFFKDNGYLILRDVLDRDLCARARERMWRAMPDDCHVKQGEPTSHVGPFLDSEASDNPLHIRQGHLWQLREAGTEPFLIDLFYNADLRAVAEQLLGPGMLEPPTPGGEPMGARGAAWPGGPTDPAIGDGIRGIYFTLPYEDKTKKPDYPHTDGHPFNLGVVGLINGVPPEGGSFRVWPKSHKRLYPTFQMQYDQPRIPYYDHMPSFKGLIQSPEYEAEMKAVIADTAPVDCHGSEGDVVLWHHRLAHMAGHNYSNVIRQAALYDFTRTDLDTARMDPPQANMWRDWSEDLGNNDTGYSAAFARSQGIKA